MFIGFFLTWSTKRVKWHLEDKFTTNNCSSGLLQFISFRFADFRWHGSIAVKQYKMCSTIRSWKTNSFLLSSCPSLHYERQLLCFFLLPFKHPVLRSNTINRKRRSIIIDRMGYLFVSCDHCQKCMEYDKFMFKLTNAANRTLFLN